MFLAYCCLAFICIIWGTTYLIIKIGVQSLPPFLLSGIRQLIAGGVLIAVLAALKKGKIRGGRNLAVNVISGILMIGFGNGLVTWSQQHVPTGIMSLICSMMPVYVVLINISAGHRDKLTPLVVTGMLAGMAGMIVLFGDSLKAFADFNYAAGIALTVVASVAWAFGSYLAKSLSEKCDPLMNAGVQMVSGGVVLLVTSLFADDHAKAVWDSSGIISLAVLIVFGSILAFGAYNYAMAKLPLAIVSLYAFVNPIIAVFLGKFYADEHVSPNILVSLLLIIGSLYLVNYGYYKKEKAVKTT